MDSITRSFGQLQLASPSYASADGPINRLPNELIQAILAKFEIPKLLSLRLVCPRWSAVIESIGHTKKSLFLCHDQHSYKATLDGVSKRFFGQVNVKRDFVQLKLSPQVLYLINVPKFGAFLVRLFPRVEQLIIKSDLMYDFHFLFDLWPEQQIATLSLIGDADDELSPVEPFADGITSLTSLKRFDLKGKFEPLLLQLISPMFVKLEHFSYHNRHNALSGPELNRLYRLFGSKCTRFWLNVSDWRITDLQQWLNPNLLSTVTCLSLQLCEDVEPLGQYIVDNFTALRVLQLDEAGLETFNLTPKLVNIFSRLDHLTELQLYGVVINLNQWTPEEVKKLKPLSTVRACTLSLSIKCNNILQDNRDRLTRILVATFPAIQRMSIQTERNQFIDWTSL